MGKLKKIQLSKINYNNDFITKEFVDYVNLKDHPKAKGVNIKFRYQNLLKELRVPDQMLLQILLTKQKI